MNIEEFNRRKQVQLINNIMNCHGDYQLVCIQFEIQNQYAQCRNNRLSYSAE